jgi:hypothetical protein
LFLRTWVTVAAVETAKIVGVVTPRQAHEELRAAAAVLVKQAGMLTARLISLTASVSIAVTVNVDFCVTLNVDGPVTVVWIVVVSGLVVEPVPMLVEVTSNTEVPVTVIPD